MFTRSLTHEDKAMNFSIRFTSRDMIIKRIRLKSWPQIFII